VKRNQAKVTDILSRKATTPSAPASPAKESAARGRPASGEPWTKATVVLYDRQVHALDDLSHEIHAKHRVKVTRAELIRAMVDAVLSSGLELSGGTSEEQLRQLVAAKLKR
jgi:hypothetical protein